MSDMKILKYIKFIENMVGEKEIDDIDTYISRMDLSIDDKLFFLDKVDFDVIVDFGCANGSLLSKIASLKPNVKLIGYDLDSSMINKAKSILNNNALITDNWLDIKSELKKYKKPLLNLSSVIHEVYSYSSDIDIEHFWSDLVFSGIFKNIAIRDMIPSMDINKIVNFEEDLLKVMDKSNHKQISEFENIWGKLGDSYHTFSHYLLKYRYVENWNREVNENYFPLYLEELKSKITNSYNISYEEVFTVPFVQQQLKKDFNIKLRENTHTKLILNLK